MNRSATRALAAAAAALSSMLVLACGGGEDEAPAAKPGKVVGVLYAGDFDNDTITSLAIGEDGSLNASKTLSTGYQIWGPIKLLYHPSGFLLVLSRGNV